MELDWAEKGRDDESDQQAKIVGRSRLTLFEVFSKRNPIKGEVTPFFTGIGT